jgi:hypothetical protein
VTEIRTIYVQLLDEAVDAWRPIEARLAAEDSYVVQPQRYDRESERWEFEPGSRVVCEERDLDGETVLVAVTQAD